MPEKKDKNQQSTGPVVQNKKAFFNYELVEKVQAGLSLLGTEVKSLRQKLCDLEGAYGRIIDGEAWLIGCKIAQYDQASGDQNHDPTRKRKLLLHRSQIKKIQTRLTERGFVLVPLKIYFNQRGLAKLELGIARGKRQFDKRAILQKKQQEKDIRRGMKKYRR